MFYFEGVIDQEGKTFTFRKAYCNFKIINEGMEDLLIYEYNNFAGRIKAGEYIEFRNYEIDEITLKSNGTIVRLWVW